ncbi:UNVERIFIED_CONTAM: hypothetical protein HDU68_012648 [Siphonaria sp. JEL0065]|nr:hypothetical protein HDU68_012648 [Siphonaria sp. JEL0065]
MTSEAQTIQTHDLADAIKGRAPLHHSTGHQKTQSPGNQTEQELKETNASNDIPRKKILVVGCSDCGTTDLLVVFTSGQFPINYMPVVFENHLIDVLLNNQVIQLSLWDTQGESTNIRALSYPETDCILLCFNVCRPLSFDMIETVYRPELNLRCPNVPFLLVGCKTELRSDAEALTRLLLFGRTFSTYQEGVALAQRIGAWRYMECSAKLNEGVVDVFEFATLVATWGNNTTKIISDRGESKVHESSPVALVMNRNENISMRSITEKIGKLSGKLFNKHQ